MALSPKPLPSLPGLAIDKIVQLLPTKAVVRMSFLSKQHEGIWSLVPFIDFVEPDDHHHDDDGGLNRHRKFINFVKKYLEYREKQANKSNHEDAALYKLSLRMQSYLCGEDANIVDKLLAFSFQRSVKKVHISLRTGKLDPMLDQDRVKLYHCLSGATFVNARSVTTLNLDHIRVNNIVGNNTEPLPCLKAMSLKNVHFDRNALFSLICGCPAIEYLSLTSCSFDEIQLQEVRIDSSSLKILQLQHCKVYLLGIHGAANLESFTFLSSELGTSIYLFDSYNLKHVNIHAHNTRNLYLFGCHESLKAIIRTPKLMNFYTFGYFKSKFYVEAPKKVSVYMYFLDLWSREVPININGCCKQFIAVRNFLQQFSCAQELTLYVRNEKGLIFPEKLRRNAFPSPILPNLRTLELIMSNPPLDVRDTARHLNNVRQGPRPQKTEETGTSELSTSLFWLASSLNKITTTNYVHG